MSKVNFPISLGGDGNDYSDDGTSTRDMPNGGWRTWFMPLVSQIIAMATSAYNSAVSAVNAPGTSGTSTTSLTIASSGTASFTTQTGKSWALGQYVTIAYTTTPTNWMAGVITSYNSGTGAMTVELSDSNGSGTQTAWTIALAAPSRISSVQQNVPWNAGNAGGTADALTATITNTTLSALTDNMSVLVAASAANTSTTPTFTLTLGATSTGAITITKKGNTALAAGDIAAADHPLLLTYKSGINKWVLDNPAVTASASSAVLMPGMVTGRYYSVGIIGNTLAAVANTVYFVPLIVPVERSIASIFANVTFYVAGNMRMGVYSNVNGAPSALLYTAGTASTGTNGEKVVALAQTLPAGVYWLAAQFSATPTMTAFNSAEDKNNIMGTYFGKATRTASSVLQGYSMSYAYTSGLPATASSLTALGGNNVCPHLGVIA